MQKIGKFTKANIQNFCPSLSISSIENGLYKLVARQEIKKVDVGKSTQYYRIK